MSIKKQSFMKGVLIIAFSQILIKVLGFLYRVITTNFKEFADMGNSYYGAGFKVYLLIIAISTVGLPGAISKLISEKMALGDKRGAHKIFKVAMRLFIITGAIFSIVMFLSSDFIATYILSNPGVALTLKVLSPSIFFVSIAAVFRGYFVGMSNMTVHSTAQIFEQIVNSVFSVVFVYLLLGTNDPIIMAAGSTAATTISTAIALVYMSIYYIKNRKDIWEEIAKSNKFLSESRKLIARKLVSISIPLSLGTIITTIAGMIDLVTITAGLQANGHSLEEANRLMGILMGKVDILTGLPMSINTAFAVALIPAITEALTLGNKKGAQQKIDTSLKFSMLIGLPCAVGIFVLAEPLLLLIFPNAPEGAELLRLSAGIIVFSIISQTAYGSLQGIGRLYVPVVCVVIAGIVKYIMNVTLISKFGIDISPISTTIYHIIAASIALYVLYKSMKMKFNTSKLIIRPCIAAVCMGVVTYASYNIVKLLVNSNAIATLVSITLSIAFYGVLVLLLKIIDKNEMRMIPVVRNFVKDTN